MSRWDGVQWHAPDGRTVFIGEDDRPCMVSVVFRDGSMKDIPFVLNGREVECVLVDGVPYRADDADEAWTVSDGRVVAIEAAGARYEIVD